MEAGGRCVMVGAEALKEIEIPLAIEAAELPEEELRWCTVRLRQVLDKGNRLEASVFDIEGKHAREVLSTSIWGTRRLGGEKGYADKIFYPGRCKRIYCSKDVPGATGFLGSAEMLDIRPVPVKFMSARQNNIADFEVDTKWILISRSGTIGNMTFVSKTLKNYLISEHAIRIVCNEYQGFIYALLKSKIGQAIIKSNIYGAVVSQIEPEHLEDIPIPNPPDALKKKIHDLIIKSYDLRDESNALLDKAEAMLYEALDLPPLDKLKPRYFDACAGLRNYSVKLSKLGGRLDGSYHVPIVESIIKQLNKGTAEVTTVGDPRISARIILPGRFARVYVEEGQGTVFFGGKQLLELDPSNKKYLSLAQHGERIKKELRLEENMVMITVSGTIGKVALTPKHWEGWAANQHIIRIVPASLDIAGYLYVFLATDYGHEFITRFTYGAVVDEIDAWQVSQIAVPILKDVSTQKEINRLALEANRKRAEAYRLELEAIRSINEEVIHVRQ
jgi:type I restriction enzyme S subunit